VIASVKHVNMKISQGSLQKIITWTKKIKKGENACWCWQWVMALKIASLGEDWIC
jgi:hypothetical protein